MIVNCCATCEHAQYSHKKGKTVHCILTDEVYHQLEMACDDFIRDEDRVTRINTQMRQILDNMLCG